jgi:hypothetical protein
MEDRERSNFLYHKSVRAYGTTVCAQCELSSCRILARKDIEPVGFGAFHSMKGVLIVETDDHSRP